MNTEFVRDFTIHYAKGKLLTKSLQAACGKPWEWITDIKAKVTCPECKEIMRRLDYLCKQVQEG